MIKCPKCGNGFSAPEPDETVSPSPAPVRARKTTPAPEEDDGPEERAVTRPRLRRPAPENDDDLDEDKLARPKRRKLRKKPKARASKTPLVLGLILSGAALVIGAVIVFAMVRTRQNRTATVAVNTPAQAKPTAPASEPSGADAPRLAPAQEPQTGEPAQEPTPQPSVQVPAVDTNSEQVAAGRQVFQKLNCARCHTVAGAGSGGRRRGPDLSRVGANPVHTVDWLMEHVRNPQSHNPDSNMPAFAGRISENDLRALANYLSNLRG
jgi:mono/diheme cytochrome c family protein